MGRSIIVGDVHGCSRELGDLLALVGPVSGDQVYFVGDLVARGPDSRGVLRRFREIGARGVIGNHEAGLLKARRARRSGQAGPPLGKSHESLLHSFDDDDWALLDSLPVYLQLAEHDALVVHAGVLPGIALQHQDARTMTNIRSIGEDGLASERSGTESWATSYSNRPHVVFGHDARRRLQLHPCATGLDTGCVYGGALTALVVPGGQTLPAPHERRDWLVSVPAHEAYYEVRSVA